MLKLLLLVLAALLVISILKHRRGSSRRSPPAEKTANMVRCDVCGVHLPESEAILSNQLHYCCEAHFLQRKQE